MEVGARICGKIRIRIVGEIDGGEEPPIERPRQVKTLTELV
jgi:hypothetical protein